MKPQAGERRWIKSVAATLAICLAQVTYGATVESSLTPLLDHTWRYDYRLVNTGPTVSFDELTVFFEDPGVDVIIAFAAPGGWDPIMVQPDRNLAAGGYVDALHLAGSVPEGSFTGFSATFRSLTAPPLTQPFQLIRSTGFVLVDSGLTTSVPSIPEPATWALMAVGIGFLARFKMRLSR